MKKFVCCIFLLLLSGVAFAQDLSLYQQFKFMQNGDTLPYRILLPENYNPQKKYPLVLFLHGRGESGNNNKTQLTHGAQLFLKPENRKNYPAIVVFPQNPVNSYWSNVQTVADSTGKRKFYFTNGGPASLSMQLVMSLLENLSQQYKIKQDQVYVMGLSMGGMGTFEIVNRLPYTFAGAVAICGGANPSIAGNLKNTNWWIFHGGKDEVVLPQYSQNMVAAMKAKGVNVKFTLFPQANHNSWDPAFAEPGLLKWLFSQKKKI